MEHNDNDVDEVSVNRAKDEHPQVLISYSHDSEAHRIRVRELANRLASEEGIDCEIDQYHEAPDPAEGWPRWMENMVERSDFVLIVATENYDLRFSGKEAKPDVGRGVAWEKSIITNELYEAKSKTIKFTPIIFDATDREFVPSPLRQRNCYHVDDEFEKIVHHIRKTQRYSKPAIKIEPDSVSAGLIQKAPDGEFETQKNKPSGEEQSNQRYPKPDIKIEPGSFSAELIQKGPDGEFETLHEEFSTEEQDDQSAQQVEVIEVQRGDDEPPKPIDNLDEIKAAFPVQVESISELIRSNEELLTEYKRAFNENDPERLAGILHGRFKDALGKLIRIARKTDRPVPDDVILNAGSSLVYFAMDPTFAENLRKGEGSKPTTVPPNISKAVGGLITSWIAGEEKYGEIPEKNESWPEKWPTTPQMEVKEGLGLAQKIVASFSAGKLETFTLAEDSSEEEIRATIEAESYAGNPVPIVLKENDPTLSEIQNDEQLNRYLKIFVVSAKGTINCEHKPQFALVVEKMITNFFDAINPISK